ncbi:MAG: DUF3429 domain-containing protein [Pseudomonadota bacterium]
MTEKAPVLPRLLTYAGILPFAGLSGGAVSLAVRAANPALIHFTAFCLLLYGAVILSFLGGIRWGAGLMNDPIDARSVGLSVLPSLAAWAMAMLAVVVGVLRPALLILAVLFAVQLVWDRQAWRRGDLPIWFGELRWAATLGAILSLVVAAVFT